MSRDQQVQLGLQSAAQVYQQMPVLPDNSPETQYIRQIGQRLVATIPADRTWPYQFHVVAQKEINAFALPGGQMFVNIGTITAAANEAQLAGVMGHEMSHVYMQHSAKQERKNEWTQGITQVAGAVLGARGGAFSQLEQQGLQMGAGMLMLKYSRTDESQADHVGAIILYKSGYNPQELANFFKTLEAQGGTPPQFMSDHPNPGNREAAIQKEIEPWPAQQYLGDSAQFAKVRQHAMGVRAYTADEIAQGAKSGQWEPSNKRNGAVFAPAAFNSGNAPQSAGGGQTAGRVALQDVMPSSKFQLVDLGPLKIARPENWEIIPPKQQGESLTIAPREGISQSGVGYGVLINGVMPKNKQASIDQVTAALVQVIEGSSGETRTLGNPSEIEFNGGVRGRIVRLQSTSPFSNAAGQAQKERDELVTIPRPDGSVLYLVFVAPESEYQNLSPTFEKMLRSVQ
jgi:hypothetical protein